MAEILVDPQVLKDQGNSITRLCENNEWCIR